MGRRGVKGVPWTWRWTSWPLIYVFNSNVRRKKRELCTYYIDLLRKFQAEMKIKTVDREDAFSVAKLGP